MQGQKERSRRMEAAASILQIIKVVLEIVAAVLKIVR